MGGVPPILLLHMACCHFGAYIPFEVSTRDIEVKSRSFSRTSQVQQIPNKLEHNRPPTLKQKRKGQPALIILHPCSNFSGICHRFFCLVYLMSWALCAACLDRQLVSVAQVSVAGFVEDSTDFSTIWESLNWFVRMETVLQCL